jgi:hypothetical protein
MAWPRFATVLVAPIALTVFATSHQVWAQAAPAAPTAKKVSLREELPANARKDWDTALEFYDANDYAKALVQFQRVYELSKHPRVLFNIGVCERQQLHYARAVEYFRRELTEGAGKLSPKDEQDAKDLIAKLQEFLSTLEVESKEAGASVLLDDHQIGVTPMAKPVAVDVGPHKLLVKKDGFKDFVQDLSISRGKPEKVTVKLEPTKLTALVEVSAAGAGNATIWVDGIDRGPTPFRGQLELGRHTFRAHAPGFVDATQTSEVTSTDPLKIQLSLATERHEGKVRIVARPAGANIEIDQHVVGSTVWEGVLPTGGHQLRVTKAGYQDYVTDISLRDDQVRRIEASLVEDKSKGVFIWATGAVAVLAGGAIASYFVFKKSEDPVQGTLAPYIVNTSYRLK